MNNVDYTSITTPPDYKCSQCGVSGVKLWRPYNNFRVDLLCAICAGEKMKKDTAHLDLNGTRQQGDERTDTIGWYIPAVPDEEGVGYWGYTSVPDAGVMWWQHLPNDAQSKADR